MKVFFINENKQLSSFDPGDPSLEVDTHLDDVCAFQMRKITLRTLSTEGCLVKYKYDVEAENYKMSNNVKIKGGKFSEDIYLSLMYGVSKQTRCYLTMSFYQPWTFVGAIDYHDTSPKSSNKVYVFDSSLSLLSQFCVEASNGPVPGATTAETRYYANPIQKFHFSRPLSSVLLVFCIHVSSQVSLLRLHPLSRLKGTMVSTVKLSSGLLLGSALWRPLICRTGTQSCKDPHQLQHELVVGGWARPSTYELHRLLVHINFRSS